MKVHDNNILEAIRYAYENEKIDYNNIPEKYKEFIDEVREWKENEGD